MKLSHRKGFIDRESYIAQYLALAIFTTGIASTIGVDDLLAAFAAGQDTRNLEYLLRLTLIQAVRFLGMVILTCRPQTTPSHPSSIMF